MVDKQINQIISDFSDIDWNNINSYYNSILKTSRPFYVRYGGVRDSNGEIEMPYYIENATVFNVRMFLVDKNLNINFDWYRWEDGKSILRSNTSHEFDHLDAATVVKLFVAVLHNDRFNDGAFARLFESGKAELLLKRFIALRPL